MNKCIVFSIAAAVLLISCISSEELSVSGDDASILSCVVNIEGVDYEVPVLPGTIRAELHPMLEGKALDIHFTCSEGAVIFPDPSEIEDWNTSHAFTVRSASGEKENTYEVSISYTGELIYNASVRISSQQALEKFSQIPYTEIGSLFLYTSDTGDPIMDLSCLSYLELIRSNLEIRDIAATRINFNSLKGAGNIDIHSPSAEEVSFPALQYVSGRFRIGNDDSGELPSQHDRLKSVDLHELQSIGRSFVLFLVPALENLNMERLEAVGENFRITGGLYENLEFIKNLSRINGELSIVGDLMSLEGFAVETIGVGLSLSLTGVTSLEPLTVLRNVPYINLSEAPVLTSFKGLENCSPAAVDITGASAVTSLEYLPLHDGMEHIKLSDMPSLAAVDKLHELRTVGDLYLINCPLISDLSPLSGIRNIDNLTISQLEGISELPEFQFTALGKLTLSRMSLLSDISGLSSIEEAASIQIDNLLNLPSLTGLDNLRKITGGNIMLMNNPLITDLDPLGNLREIEFIQQTDRISITMNRELVDYSGVAEFLIKYWNGNDAVQPRVSISMNKYNPTLEQLENGEYVMPS